MEGITFYFEWEVALMEWIQSVMGDAGAAVASVWSMLGEEMVLIAVLGFLYWVYDKENGKYVGTNILVGIVWNPLFKNLVLRRRPYFDNPTIKCLKPVNPDADLYDIAAQGYSFPSGHSTNAAIVYGSLAVKKKSIVLRVLAIVLPLLVGVSRFMVGVHYPTDVLTGWLLGILVIAVMTYLQSHVKRVWLLHLVLFLISAIGLFYCRTEDYFTGLGLMGGFFLAMPFEEKFVRFENTTNILRGILRIAGGFAVYLGLNTLLKLPFSSEFLETATMAAFMVRFARYFIVGFVTLGVYPLVFRKEKA